MWRRWFVLLLLGLVYLSVILALTTFLVWFIFDPLESSLYALELIASPRDWNLMSEAWWYYCAWPSIILVVTQLLFLWPIHGGRVRARPDGKPLTMMVASAGFVGAVLTIGLFLGIGGAIQLVWSVSTGSDPSDFDPGASEAVGWLVLLVALVCSWIVWTIALRRFAARHTSSRAADRIAGLLLKGTLAEIIVLLPIDIMMRRRTDCYCSTGSFFAMCLSAWALLWLCGPGAYLAVTSKRRREWALHHCDRCGYDKGPSPGDKCPECGHAWNEGAGAKPQAAVASP